MREGLLTREIVTSQQAGDSLKRPLRGTKVQGSLYCAPKRNLVCSKRSQSDDIQKVTGASLCSQQGQINNPGGNIQ